MTIRETPAGGDVGLPHAGFLSQPVWREAFPWLLQGITAPRGTGAPDLRAFGPAPSLDVFERWEALRAGTSMPRVVVSRQVHQARVGLHAGPDPGLLLLHGLDGHLTRDPGLLLAVTVADCVPVYLVHPGERVVGLLHAGWRGTVAGILEEAFTVLDERLALSPTDVHLHLGPAICGDCYEVGPEVHRALGFDPPEAPRPVDLRAELARRAGGAGVGSDRISRSAFCTRCGDPPFFSHRRGDAGRQAALLGIRWRGVPDPVPMPGAEAGEPEAGPIS